MSLSRQIIACLALILLAVQAGNWSLEINIATSEYKYVCPEAFTRLTGTTDTVRVNHLHEAYLRQIEDVFGHG